MQHNLRTSAKRSDDAYDVTVSLTGYEPNDMVFNELGNSEGSFSYVTTSSDLDIDDTSYDPETVPDKVQTRIAQQW